MTKKPMTNSDGCLWFFITIIFTVIGFGVLKILTNISTLPAFLIGFTFAILFSTKIIGRPSVKIIVRQGLIMLVIFFGLKIIGGILLTLIKTEPPARFEDEEIVVDEILVEENDTIPVFTSKRSWRDNLGNNFQGSLTVRQSDYTKLQNSIKTYKPTGSKNFWGNLYFYLERNDAPSLDLVMEMFGNIHKEKQLSQMEFAEMVVTCIQDIPYSFVFQDACLPAANYEDSIKDILTNCPECCIGNVVYGIQNPVSFIGNLKGDCDTRTVLIYSILKHFNYDVAILNSEFYKHSILGLNIPSAGKIKFYKGKKYVLWETTAKYFSAGVLPSNFDDIRQWNVVLTSK